MKRIPALTCLFLCIVAATTAQAQNWPSFRGNNGSGVADGHRTPTSWSLEKSENIAWKTPVPGLSHASPIVWGNRIFIITAIGETNANFKAKDRGIGLANDAAKHTWRIYSLDKKTGRIIWEKTAYEGVPRRSDHIKANRPTPLPQRWQKYVWLFGSEGWPVLRVNGKLSLGKVLDSNRGYAGVPAPSGDSSSPIISKNIVPFQADAIAVILAAYISDGQKVGARAGELPSWETPSLRSKIDGVDQRAGRYLRTMIPLTERACDSPKPKYR